MSVDNRYWYVQGMRNIAWLAGYFRRIDGKCYIQQNNNLEQMIPISVPEEFVLPPDKTPAEAACHIYGKRVDDEQQCDLRVIKIYRPSIRSMPAMSTWLRGGAAKDAEFNPFTKGGAMRREILEKVDSGSEVSEHEKALAEWFRYTGKRLNSSLGENANKVFLAGFVGATRFVPPNEHQKHGYGEIYLHQHLEQDRAIPVRLYNHSAQNMLRSLRKGLPIALQGQIRMKVLPDDEGRVRSRSLHVRVEEVYATDPARDFVSGPPAWWSRLFMDGRQPQPKKDQPRSAAAIPADDAPAQDRVPADVLSDL